MALETARQTRALRELRSLAREVGANDPEAFADLVALAAEMGELVKDAAHQLRTEGGYSWAALAAPLGRTRATVQQRYGRTPEELGARVATTGAALAQR
jgi:hypothetical protein